MDFLRNSPLSVPHCMEQIMLNILHYEPLRILAPFVISTISSLLFAFCFRLFTFSSHISFSASPSHVSMVLLTFLPFLAHFQEFSQSPLFHPLQPLQSPPFIICCQVRDSPSPCCCYYIHLSQSLQKVIYRHNYLQGN